MMQKPSIGRMVHFVGTPAGQHWPAVVTRVWSDSMVNLHVFPDDASYFVRTSCKLDAVGVVPNSWHWPEKMEEIAQSVSSRMTAIGDVRQAALELCWQIEKCAASEECTKASVMASALATKLNNLLP